MKKAAIWIGVFFIVLIGISALIYFKYERPNQNGMSKDMVDISISAEFNGKRVATGLLIRTFDGDVNVITSSSHELITVRANQIIYITNENINEQTFYIKSKQYDVGDGNMRIDVVLEEPSEITVSTLLKNANNVTVDLYSHNLIDPKFCLVWSLNYYLVQAQGFRQIPKLDKYRNWDKCYAGDFSLSDSNQTIEITFQTFSTATQDDFMNISIIDPQLDSINDKNVRIV